MEERGEGTLSGRGKVRMEEGGGEGKIERRRQGCFFMGLVFWILTSQLCVCVRVCG